MKQQNVLPGISLSAPSAADAASSGTRGAGGAQFSAPVAGAGEAPRQDAEDWPPMARMLQSLFVFESSAVVSRPITVMGLDCAGRHDVRSLTPAQRALVREADVICAGESLLNALSCPAVGEGPAAGMGDDGESPAQQSEELHAQLLPLRVPLEPLLTRMSQLRAAGRRVLVLANGDPLLFGIGATLVRRLGAEAVRLLPAVSSLQQACARIGLPWHRVVCLSLHGRDDLQPLNAACGRGVPLCILADARMTPDVLARHLLDRGVDWFEAHIFERMGTPDESVAHLRLDEVAGGGFGPACTMVLVPTGTVRRPRLGLDEGLVAANGGPVSKGPVRACALSLLRIEPFHVVWDIGAGSGAVSLEAAAIAHEGRVVAVERSPGRAMGIQENRRRLGAATVDVRLGAAPECLPDLPDPDRVFIGGGLSGGDGEDILRHVCHRLPVGGRVVASCVLLESLHLCRCFFEDAGWPLEVLQVAVARGRELGGDMRLAGQNPVFLLAAQKPAGENGKRGT